MTGFIALDLMFIALDSTVDGHLRNGDRCILSLAFRVAQVLGFEHGSLAMRTH